MRVEPVRTRTLTPGALSVGELLDDHLPALEEGCVVAITSKAVSLCEGRVVSPAATHKTALVEQEAERFLAEPGRHGFVFTVTRNTLIPSAGIDESNGGGDYVLWPADPQASANAARRHLREHRGLERVGVVITDSTCSPLRRGTSGICLAHSGFLAVNSYVGSLDLFGRPFAVSQANVAGGLAAAAVVAMGEGAERTPLCVASDVPFVRFQDRDPSEEELGETYIPPEDDLFAPFLSAVAWRSGRGGRESGQ